MRSPLSGETATRSVPIWSVGAVVALFLALAWGGVVTNMPWTDEAWFSCPGYNLITHGYFGTSVLDPTAAWHVRDLRGIDRRTYWIVPLYPLTQAGWQWIGGSTLFSIRFYSVAWGLVAMAGWAALILKLDGDPWSAFLMAALLSIDFQFIWSSSVARMDMMCAALGVCGLAAYAWLRERGLFRAVLVGSVFVAAACFSHPTALGYFVAFAAFAVYLDHSRLRLSLLIAWGAPYMVAAAGWGLYIAGDYRMFLDQFGGNVGGRFPAGGFLNFLKSQIFVRYLEQYGFEAGAHGLSHIKAIALGVYVAGAVAALLTPAIRRDRPRRGLIVVWLALAVTLSLIDKELHHFYIIHFMLPMMALLAVWMRFIWRDRPQQRLLVAGMAAALALANAAVLFSRYRSDPYHHEYAPAIAFLRDHASAGLIMGSSELAFGLPQEFDARLVDDYRLGYKSGKRPAIVVLDRNRYREWIPNLREQEPAAYDWITGMLNRDFKLEFENPDYSIYVRTAPPGEGGD